MSGRKPRGMSFSSWVEGQIKQAQRSGGFDNLPGHGKPMPAEATSDDPMAWVAAKLRREGVPAAAVLPPSLALAKEVEDLPEELDRLRSEREVRAHLEDLNARIRSAHLRPQEGPPLRVRQRDVDTVVGAWQERRAAQDGQTAIVEHGEISARSRWRGTRGRR